MVSWRLVAAVVVGLTLATACKTTENAGGGEDTEPTIGQTFRDMGAAIARAFDNAGGWVSAKYGEWLGREDREGLSDTSATAAETGRDGETVEWANTETGTNARVTPTNTRTERRNITVVRDARVVPTANMILIGKTYEARENANIRAGPSTTHVIVRGLAAGETFNAVGRVEGADWILVGKGKRSVGYVYAPLVREAAVQEQAEMRTAVNLDDIELDDDTVVEKVSVQTSCRTLTYEVESASGDSAADTFQACKQADGAWEID
jgi:surface antigen